jgi:hypothetical protein
MLGWHISVYRQASGGSVPGEYDSEQGPRLAVWQGDRWGLAWIDELVKAGQAIDLGGGGCPTWFTAQAEHLIPPILGGPPSAREIWTSGPDDVLTSQWAGKTVINHAVVDGCRADEWLLVVAWDES